MHVAKLVAIGYGIKKLQIGCVVEDDKVSREIFFFWFLGGVVSFV